MTTSYPNRLCCLTIAALLLSLAGCDLKFPLTSPSRATVDSELLGVWGCVFAEQGDRKSVIQIGAATKSNLASQKEFPRNGMILNAQKLPMVCWPTTVGNTRYLNATTYDSDKQTLDSGSRAYVIVKYEVKDDKLEIHRPSNAALTRMRSRLGDDYNSADLLQEIVAETDWELVITGTRLKF